MSGTTLELTLEEELEKAADIVIGAATTEDENAAAWQDESDGPRLRAFAGRLRARAARVRELLDLAHAQKFNGGRRELARALAGPLSPTEPAATPTDTTQVKGR